MKDIKKEYGYGIALLFALICIGRTIPLFVNCFSTAWLSYTLIGGIMLFSFLFFEKQKWIYGVVALLLVNWICYCGESGFVFPLSMGMSTLIFQRRMITARCKAYCWMLIGSALLFLLLYAVLVLPYIDNIYDSSHGTTDNMLMNAIRMTFAQKIILVAFVVLVVRLVDMIRNNSKCNFFDSLLFTAAACCCGNFILRLNWTLYYNGVALIALPSILYFSINYLKEKWTMVLFVFLMVFYGRKIPGTIWENQQLRKETFEAVSNLYREMDKAEAVYWYMPVANGGNPQSLIVRDWKYNSLSTYLVWMKHEPDYKLPIAKEFHGGKNTIWLTTSENQTLFPDDNLLQENGELFFNSTGIEGYWIKE